MENILSFKVATTLTSERIVYVSAANTVAYQNTVTSLPIGITTNDVDGTTQGIPVKISGIAKCLANDTFSAGDLVTGDASGRAVPFTAVTAATAYVGVALEAVAATGTRADILIQPSFHDVF